ncbi:MAG: hypothetical protein B0W54_09250 [Cellvibrio sp. 79]|nr:MAG: hypothetical protein B0W54_09250 [Cellvibrio sp. 79]
MRIILLSALLITSLTTVAADNTTIKRHQLNEWEKDIGYSGVVEVNNQLFISGVACSGKTMEEAVKYCYTTVQDILKKFNTTSGQIIKETVYTTDIDALIKAIPTRKSFFNQGQYPAATWVQISRLYSPEVLLEVELIVQRK